MSSSAKLKGYSPETGKSHFPARGNKACCKALTEHLMIRVFLLQPIHNS